MLSGVALALWAEPAAAAGAEASGKVELNGGRATETGKEPWIRRWPPARVPGMAEIGVYGGVIFPSRAHELFDSDPTLSRFGFKPLRRIAPEVGLRAGYYPMRFFGVELEGGLMPTRTTDDQSATLYSIRGHAVAQLGLWSVTPFALIGFGGTGVASSRGALGNDIDMSLHFGGGVKIYMTRLLALRLDVRDVVAAQRGVEQGLAHNPEVLLGLSLTLGRKKPAPPVRKDSDGDGFFDEEDRCPTEPGVAPDGCPIGDRDRDTFMDDVDKCPDEPGVEPDGCPIRDRDKDGFKDDVDTCPDEPGVEPDGCPIRDSDGDKILDPDDKCKDEPETRNGFEDTDGCPDELPPEVKKFTGVIEGIFFDVNKATIRRKSAPVLDRAVEVLKEYPDIRLEISGHTDSTGKREYNIELSRRRAEAVKKYMTDHGVDPSRIETRGAGPDEPLADNATREGRDKNRRTEFKVLAAQGGNP
jgi:OOP family OmpA-OmpF porin